MFAILFTFLFWSLYWIRLNRGVLCVLLHVWQCCDLERSRSHSLKVAATSAVSLLSDDVGPHMDAYEAILRRRPRVMSLNGER